MSGQAGTVMDWNDGKEYGEFTWKSKDGAFSKRNYPSQLSTISVVRAFMSAVPLDDTCVVGGDDSRVSFKVVDGAYALGLSTSRGVWGWVYFPNGVKDKKIVVSGLSAGRYVFRALDPWTGMTIVTKKMVVSGDLVENMVYYLSKRTRKRNFPHSTRKWRGRDVAFSLTLDQQSKN